MSGIGGPWRTSSGCDEEAPARIKTKWMRRMRIAEKAIEVPSRRWDRIGVWASVGCSIHCLATPFLFLAMPAIAGIWAHPGAHASMAVFVVPLAAGTLFRGYRVHAKSWVAVAAIVGISSILLGSALSLIADDDRAPRQAPLATVPAEPIASDEDRCGACCPRLVQDGDGRRRLEWPAASIVTIAGSILLVTGHLGNLARGRCRPS